MGFKYSEGFSQDNWEQEIEEHPAFRTKPFEDGEEIPPMIAAIQALQYEDESDEDDQSEAYRVDGNYHFKAKRYEKAVIDYTQGLKNKDKISEELSSKLLLNRAVANFELGNYRSCFEDCSEALKYNQFYSKALFKITQACLKLKKFDEGLKHINTLLACEASDIGQNKISNVQSEIFAAKQKYERDCRKEEARARQLGKRRNELGLEFAKRNYSLSSRHEDVECVWQSILFPETPDSSQIYLERKGTENILHWPVLLLYPEHNSTDFIKDFSEVDTFDLQLRAILGDESNIPTWNESCAYNPESVSIHYHEDVKSEKFYEISAKKTLKENLSQIPLELTCGSLSFVILLRNSDFERKYLTKI